VEHKKKNPPQPCFEVPSSVLGVLGMVETKNILSCPPTSDIKNSKACVKKITPSFSMEI
jgi:hypothetical protein